MGALEGGRRKRERDAEQLEECTDVAAMGYRDGRLLNSTEQRSGHQSVGSGKDQDGTMLLVHQGIVKKVGQWDIATVEE